jgi:acyl carrier protein
VTTDLHSPLQVMKQLVQRELGLDASQLDASSPLHHLGDSLDWVNLLTALEAHFEMRINDTQAARLRTVGDLMVLVHGAHNVHAQAEASESPHA